MFLSKHKNLKINTHLTKLGWLGKTKTVLRNHKRKWETDSLRAAIDWTVFPQTGARVWTPGLVRGWYLSYTGLGCTQVTFSVQNCVYLMASTTSHHKHLSTGYTHLFPASFGQLHRPHKKLSCCLVVKITSAWLPIPFTDSVLAWAWHFRVGIATAYLHWRDFWRHCQCDNDGDGSDSSKWQVRLQHTSPYATLVP